MVSLHAWPFVYDRYFAFVIRFAVAVAVCSVEVVEVEVEAAVVCAWGGQLASISGSSLVYGAVRSVEVASPAPHSNVERSGFPTLCQK
jgi:hypothetical protein